MNCKKQSDLRPLDRGSVRSTQISEADTAATIWPLWDTVDDLCGKRDPDTQIIEDDPDSLKSVCLRFSICFVGRRKQDF